MNSNWSYSSETLNSGQNRWFFLCRVTLKFYRWTWIRIGHLFYATSRFVIIFQPLMNSNWIYSPETPKLGQNLRFFVPCALQIWQMTLGNNRAFHLTYFKLRWSFRSYWWIRTGVKIQKRPIWVKNGDFLSRVTLQFDRWPEKAIGHPFCATSSFVHNFVIAISYIKLVLLSVNF